MQALQEWVDKMHEEARRQGLYLIQTGRVCQFVDDNGNVVEEHTYEEE